MPIAVHITPQTLTKADYERMISELEASGVEPNGRLYHAAFGDENVEIFEVWESPAHFDSHRDRMMSALQSSGVDAGIGRARIEPLHSTHPD